MIRKQTNPMVRAEHGPTWQLRPRVPTRRKALQLSSTPTGLQDAVTLPSHLFYLRAVNPGDIRLASSWTRGCAACEGSAHLGALQSRERATIEPYGLQSPTPWQWATSCFTSCGDSPAMQLFSNLFGPKPGATDQGGTTPSNGNFSGSATRCSWEPRPREQSLILPSPRPAASDFRCSRPV